MKRDDLIQLLLERVPSDADVRVENRMGYDDTMDVQPIYCDVPHGSPKATPVTPDEKPLYYILNGLAE